MLTKLREAGMNIARLNFSHGKHEVRPECAACRLVGAAPPADANARAECAQFHQGIIDNLRESIRRTPLRSPVAIALDTKGPEIRTGMMKDGQDVRSVACPSVVVRPLDSCTRAL